MNNLIACFQVILCLRNKNVLACRVTVQYEKKRDLFCSQLHCIEFNVLRTNSSIKHPRGKNCELYRIGPDQLYSRAFALRPNRVLVVLAIFKRVIGGKMIALRLRTSATSSASPLMSFSSLSSYNLERATIWKNKHTQYKARSTNRKQTRSLRALPRKRK